MKRLLRASGAVSRFAGMVWLVQQRGLAILVPDVGLTGAIHGKQIKMTVPGQA